MAFSTEAPQYAWLVPVLAQLDGEFDETTGRSTRRVYVPDVRPEPKART